MPTTYTNGLKLPDLGSIDWYNSYKNNIDILDPIVGTVNGVATTYAPISHNHSASEITSGTIDIARLPPAALERMHIVADQTARYALTTSTVQEGDTVKQTDTGVMYLVVDSTKLNSADGYTEYSAGTASKAIADEDGTSIKTGYVNRTTNQSIAGQKTFTDNTFFTTDVYHKNTTYESGNIPLSNIVTNIYLADKSNVYTGYVRSVLYASGRTATEIRAKNIFKNGVLDPTGSDISSNLNVEVQPNGTKTIYWDGLIRNDVTPFTTNNNSLGSSTNQWSSVYAQTYFYNGVAWGLDQANTWTGSNIFKSANTNLGFQSTVAETGSTTASSNWMHWIDKNGYQDAYISRDFWNNGADTLRIILSGKRSNGAPSTSGTAVECGIRLDIAANGSKSVNPYTNGDTDLGTSTNKWKTLNGINPGALSLPINANSASYNIDTTNWTTDGSMIAYTPLLDGWIYINARNDDTNGDSFIIFDDGVSSFGTSVFGNKGLPNNGVGLLCLMMPVNKNNGINIRIKSPGIISARLYPCNGNV